MDFVKVQAQKIKEQLAGLTPSQRMLAGSLVVIMVMTMVWWSRYAASSEMVDLLAQDLSPDEINRIVDKVTARGIESKVVGSRVQVPAERQREVLALITFEQVAPADMSTGFDEVVQRMNSPWLTDRMQDAMLTRGKEATLAQFMRSWPGVRDARVMINNVTKRGFGDAAVSPSATVNLQMKDRGAKPDKRLPASAASAVAGVVPGLNRAKVVVLIDGASYSIPDASSNSIGGAPDSYIDRVKEGESYYADKIQSRLAQYGSAIVSVTVDPTIQSTQIERETYDKSKTFIQPSEVNEKTDESTTTSRGPAEPGTVPNTGGGGANQPLSVASAAGGGAGEGTTSTTSDTKTKNAIFPTLTREWITSPAGAASVIGASVSIPRSYLVRVFKATTGSNKDPDQAALQPLVDAELLKVKNAVMGCATRVPENKIFLDYYYDDLPNYEAIPQPAVASALPLAITGHAKEIALGLLAVVSLFMVSMMVRKSTPSPIIAPQSERPAAVANAAQRLEDIAGEAGEGLQSMDGMEVDDDAIRTQQMIGQVSNMVKENPDGAANLVKRWLSRA